MGQTESRTEDDYKTLVSQLSSIEVAAISESFRELHKTAGNEGHLINLEEFSKYFNLPVVLGHRLFQTLDTKRTNTIDYEEFLCGAAMFFHGSFEEKGNLLFNMFNISGGAGIDKHELSTIMGSVLNSTQFIMKGCGQLQEGAILSELAVSDIVDKLVKQAFDECDVSRTGKLSQSEFIDWLNMNPDLVEHLMKWTCPVTPSLLQKMGSDESIPIIHEDAQQINLVGAPITSPKSSVEASLEVCTEILSLDYDPIQFDTNTRALSELAPADNMCNLMDISEPDKKFTISIHSSADSINNMHDSSTNLDAINQLIDKDCLHANFDADEDESISEQSKFFNKTNENESDRADHNNNLDTTRRDNNNNGTEINAIGTNDAEQPLCDVPIDSNENSSAMVQLELNVTATDQTNINSNNNDDNNDNNDANTVNLGVLNCSESVNNNNNNNNNSISDDSLEVGQVDKQDFEHPSDIDDEPSNRKSTSELEKLDSMQNIPDSIPLSPVTKSSDEFCSTEVLSPSLASPDDEKGTFSAPLLIPNEFLLSDTETSLYSTLWIPSLATRDAIKKRQYLHQHPVPADLSLLDDASQAKLTAYLSEYGMPAEPIIKIINATSTNTNTDTIAALENLLVSRNYLGALDLTKKLIFHHRSSSPKQINVEYSPTVLQIWLCRFTIMAKLRLFRELETEMELLAGPGFDRPDMYFEFYPTRYNNKHGWMIPFGLILLYAVYLQYLGQHRKALNRLYVLHATIKQVKEHINQLNVSANIIKQDLTLWSKRANKILASIGNCLVSMSDYRNAVKVFRQLADQNTEFLPNHHLLMSKIHILAGDTTRAKQELLKVSNLIPNSESNVNYLITHGILSVAEKKYDKASQQFSRVLEVCPANPLATNNIAFCHFYLGNLELAANIWENEIYNQLPESLHGCFVTNLLSVLGMFVSQGRDKKIRLLDVLAKHSPHLLTQIALKNSAQV